MSKTISQITDTILMVSPKYFGFNPETFKTNRFMHKENINNLSQKALEEFEQIVLTLREENVNVIVLDSKPNTPDAVFPNNWFISLISNNENILSIFPMLNESRKREVQEMELIKIINPDQIIDMRIGAEGNALEGTGSIVLDRLNKICYACISPRTNENLLKGFASKVGFEVVKFKADIYHTNVMMAIGEEFTVACLECIPDLKEREFVKTRILETQKELIEISVDQLNHFCGNILQIKNSNNEKFICMSTTAYKAFSREQLNIIEKFGKILHFDTTDIEIIGGGSVRCMMGELFLN